MRIRLFAFDLDGTLLDTAPDFFKAVNKLRNKYSLGEADYDQVRCRVSQGAASLATYALDLEGQSPEKIEIHRQELLKIYEECCLDNTDLFKGVEEVLNKLNAEKVKWGIITNKPRKFAELIVYNKLGDFEIPFLICPDDVGVRKPKPDGLLHALDLSRTKSIESIYIGDHRIDVMAGKSADMITGAAAYGYIPMGDNVKSWDADFIFSHPEEILNLIKND